ncbi:MAG: hypothetical protein IJB15_02030 [Clostridia bacterium]|nr:hypothetical protein [Clostridia bacterium]
MKKKILLMMLVMAMLAGCGKTPVAETEEQQNTETETAAQTEQDDPYRDDLPEMDFNGEGVSIAVWNHDDVVGEFHAEELSGEVVNDAVYNRNLAVENRLNMKMDIRLINSDQIDGVDDTIEAAVTAGDSSYDMMCSPTVSCVYTAAGNVLLDLTELENLNLDKPYWSQGAREALTVGDSLYVCTGTPSITLYRYMYVTVFNNAVFENNNLEDPITLVREGKWTLDKQAELTSGLYVDINGDGVKDENDSYGFVGGGRTNSDTYWTNCGVSLFGRDDENYYSCAPDVERYVAALEAIQNLYYHSDGSYVIPLGIDGVREPHIQNMFSEGRAAMATSHFYGIEFFLRDMEDEFTIIPMPKLDEAQEYKTYVQDQYTSLAVTTTVAPDRQPMVGAFMEVLASESYYTVYNAYYETALSKKYLQNEESVEMLHLIYDNVAIEPSVLFTHFLGFTGGVPIGYLREKIGNNQQEMASSLASWTPTITNGLADIKEAFKALKQ